MKNIKKYWFEILIILILILAVSFNSSAQKFNIDSIRTELVKQDIKHPNIVLKQIILETGWLKCTHCSLDSNNLFGFWYMKAYKRFDNWKDGVIYLKRWQDKWYKGGSYYAFLECVRKHTDGTCMRYATDPLYIDKLKGIRI